jgi:predicted O-methyltransferase YrrM
MRAYRDGIALQVPESVTAWEVASDYYDTVTKNVEFFLRDKPNKMVFRLEEAQQDFPTFWHRIGAKGDLQSAMAEWSVSHNKTPSSPKAVSRVANPPKQMQASPEMARSSNPRVRRRDALLSFLLPTVLIVGSMTGAWLNAVPLTTTTTAAVLLWFCSVGTITLFRRLQVHVTNVGDRIVSRIGRQLEDVYAQQMAADNVRAQLEGRPRLPRMGAWAILPDFADLALSEARGQSAQLVLECGSGASTLVLASFFKTRGSGYVLSLEHDEEYARSSTERLKAEGLEAFARVIYAPLIDIDVGGETWRWYDTTALSDTGFDLAIIDGPPADTQPLARYPFFSILGGRLNDGCVVLLDDANRDDEQRIVQTWSDQGFVLKVTKLETARGAVRLVAA